MTDPTPRDELEVTELDGLVQPTGNGPQPDDPDEQPPQDPEHLPPGTVSEQQ